MKVTGKLTEFPGAIKIGKVPLATVYSLSEEVIPVTLKLAVPRLETVKTLRRAAGACGHGAKI